MRIVFSTSGRTSTRPDSSYSDSDTVSPGAAASTSASTAAIASAVGVSPCAKFSSVGTSSAEASSSQVLGSPSRPARPISW